MLPSKAWNSLSPELYVTFWGLTLYDLYVPKKRYESEIAKQHSALKAFEEISDNSHSAIAKRKKDKERIQEVLDRLSSELQKQEQNVAAVHQRVVREKDSWLTSCPDSLKINMEFLQRCIFPRCVLSMPDAVYCAKFVHTLHSLGTPFFNTVNRIDVLICKALPPMICCCTEFEAGRLGRFLYETLKTGYYSGMVYYSVIQAAREYFFSASSLDSSEIWKAKECLDLFPSSEQVKAEDDVIDAITVKLPRLGVTLLPVQFRQIRNPMEIIKMAITSKTGAYLKAEELIEVARLLGLNSPDDIAMVEEAIAREAVTTGDLQLVVDLCLVLVRKDHGPIWDLCAALGRGPNLDKLDLQSRKELLGFALSHCDDESVGELLYAWKEIDLASQCENLGNALGKKVPTLSDQEALIDTFPMKSREEIMDLIERSGGDPIDTLQLGEDEELILKILMDSLSNVTK